MLNLKDLTSINYWITTYPGPLENGFLIFFVALFAVLIGGSIALYIYERSHKAVLPKPYRKLFGKVRSFGYTMGLFGFIWLFFAYEMIPLLSARFWFLAWGIATAIWIYNVLFAYQAMKQELAAIKEREKKNRYL